MQVRKATLQDVEAINHLRKQVNDLHVNARPDVFKAGFGEELQNYIYIVLENPLQSLLVVEVEGKIVGMALVEQDIRPENAYMNERRQLNIAEICVDSAFRRQGVARALLASIEDLAKKLKMQRVVLSVWNFNEDALALYENTGYHCYMRHMEKRIEN